MVDLSIWHRSYTFPRRRTSRASALFMSTRFGAFRSLSRLSDLPSIDQSANPVDGPIVRWLTASPTQS